MKTTNKNYNIVIPFDGTFVPVDILLNLKIATSYLDQIQDGNIVSINAKIKKE